MEPFLPPGAAIHDLPVYIESTRLPPASPAENQGFVYLGRLVREKGVLMLARAAALEDLPLVFVGSGALEEQVREINPKAVITGWVDHRASVEHLRQSRALVFSSLWYETLGLVVLEAAAHGIPSIVPDTSAASEIIEDGVTGLLFRGGDEADLRSRMLQLNNPEFAATLGRNAYDRFWATEHPSLDAHTRSLEAIYEGMLDRNGRVAGIAEVLT